MPSLLFAVSFSRSNLYISAFHVLCVTDSVLFSSGWSWLNGIFNLLIEGSCLLFAHVRSVSIKVVQRCLLDFVRLFPKSCCLFAVLVKIFSGDSNIMTKLVFWSSVLSFDVSDGEKCGSVDSVWS